MLAKLILIGAGPGDPELLTLKGFYALKTADVVLYDSLVNTKIFDLVYNDMPSPELIFVGKRKGFKSNPQEAINELILSRLQMGQVVIRLKGGDPLIFSRGIEEIAIAHNNGYDYEIIPGLTSGLAAASLAGIALTLREKSPSLHIATGHDINKQITQSWKAILEQGSTLIIYMGLSNIVKITKLLALDQMPAVVITNASQIDAKIIHTTLNDTAQQIINHKITSPALIILGKHINQGFKPITSLASKQINMSVITRSAKRDVAIHENS